MTAEILSSIAGVVISLAASYVPGFSDWYARLDGSHKRLLMLGMLAVSSIGIYALACAQLGEALEITLRCDQEGALTLARAFLTALVSSQAAFTISPQVHK